MDILFDFSRLLLLTLLGLSGFLGVLAIVSPQAFAKVAKYGGTRIYSLKRQPSWVDIDEYVITQGRLFGLAIIGSEAFIWFIATHGPESYSKAFLLVSFCGALLVGSLALGYIMWQRWEIVSNLAEARTDGLTGLANRRAFDLELTRRLAEGQRLGTPVCLQIIDIDKFKPLNDNFGHLLGDAILQNCAKTLVAEAREVDTVARLGGDEFAIILLGSDLQEATAAAERFRSAITNSVVHYDGQEHTITISSGLTEAQRDDDVVSLIKRADSALYAAKEAGRNCIFRHGGPEPAINPLLPTDPATPTGALGSGPIVSVPADALAQ